MSGQRNIRTLTIQLVENDGPSAGLVQIRVSYDNEEYHCVINPKVRPTIARDTIVDAVETFLANHMHEVVG